MAGGIFVSYRRDDAKHAAGRLVDRLGRAFPSEQLFLDVDNIAPGLNFKKVLADKVGACDVLLAVIGPRWLASTDEGGGRRLDNPKDFVRIEIEAALARAIPVIPVLVDGAHMPSEAQLPESLRPLADHQAVRLAHERFASDADDLNAALSKMLRPSRRLAGKASGVRSLQGVGVLLCWFVWTLVTNQLVQMLGLGMGGVIVGLLPGILGGLIVLLWWRRRTAVS